MGFMSSWEQDVNDSSGNAAETKQRVVEVITSPDCPADTEPPVILVQGKVLKKFNQVRQHRQVCFFFANVQECSVVTDFHTEIRTPRPSQDHESNVYFDNCLQVFCMDLKCRDRVFDRSSRHCESL